MSANPETIDRVMRKIRRERGQDEAPEGYVLERKLVRPEEEEKKLKENLKDAPSEPTWSDPNSWSLSMKFAPAAVLCLACFIAIYYQHFFGNRGLDMTNWESCMASFDYGIPIKTVRDQVETLPEHSWECGTAAEALLEYTIPERAVFSSNAFPNDEVPKNRWTSKWERPLRWAMSKISVENQTLYVDDLTGVSDPASLGVSAVLLGQKSKMGMQAATRQKDYLLDQAPRYKNGAISHRADVVELWSDAISMFPPFLAYYAVSTQDLELMKEAVEQIRLYHDVLAYKDTPRQHLWRHIVGPEHADDGAWSTGNAWAAYGMARVRATIAHWTPANESMAEQQDDLDRWTSEMVGAVMRRDNDESGLLRNYLDDQSWFGETSGTALMAATVYRMAVLRPEVLGVPEYVNWAHRKRQAVMDRVDQDGFAKPAVNPLMHGSRQPVDRSADGQSFLLMMMSAWRDCVCAGVCSAEDGRKRYESADMGTGAAKEEL